MIKSTDGDGDGVVEGFLKHGIKRDSGQIDPGFDFTTEDGEICEVLVEVLRPKVVEGVSEGLPPDGISD